MPSKPNRGGVKVGTQQYKTQACRNLAQTGFCKFGDRCTFLHDSDLTFPPSHQRPSSIAAEDAQSEGVWEDIEDEYDGAPSLSSKIPPFAASGEAVGGGPGGGGEVLELDWKNMDQLQEGDDQSGVPLAGESSIGQQQQQRGGSYRTKVCRHYLRGTCQMGERCNFLHTDSLNVDSVPPPVASAATPNKKRPYKVTPCHFFFNAGGCKKDDCSFSHGEVSATADAAPSPSRAAASPSRVTSAHTSHPLYKTQPCVYYMQGTCAKGDACTFRHDARSSATVDCAFFLKTGRCDFGDNCRYRHPSSSTSNASASSLPLPTPRLPKPRQSFQSPDVEQTTPVAVAAPGSVVDDEEDEQIEVVDDEDDGGWGAGAQASEVNPAGGWEADVGQLASRSAGKGEDELDKLFDQMGV